MPLSGLIRAERVGDAVPCGDKYTRSAPSQIGLVATMLC
jgi:hypothetical protein